MKVISILQPWASLVVLGHKEIETRSWNTKYRGELLIHASAKKPTKAILAEYAEWVQRFGIHCYQNESFPHRAIIGKVNLVDTNSTNDFTIGKSNKILEPAFLFANYSSILEITEQERAFGDYSPGRFGWLLSDRVAFNVPIPAKGQLGLWEYDIENIKNS